MAGDVGFEQDAHVAVDVAVGAGKLGVGAALAAQFQHVADHASEVLEQLGFALRGHALSVFERACSGQVRGPQNQLLRFKTAPADLARPPASAYVPLKSGSWTHFGPA